MIFLGIDPGVQGGISAVDELGHMVRATGMPLTPADVYLEFQAYKGFAQDVRAVLELASAGWSGRSGRMGVSQAFQYGRGYGHLEAFLLAANIPYDAKVPRTWQTAMGCLSGGDKNVTKRRAEQLFPNLKITHKLADSLLIAEFCRRFHLGIGTNGGSPTKGQQ